MPETVPQMSADDIRALHGLPYEEIAFRVMRPFVGDTFDDETFGDLIAKSYAQFGHGARAPLVQLGSGHFLCELFHGPTLAFKDFAMQLIGQLFEEALTRSGEPRHHRRRDLRRHRLGGDRGLPRAGCGRRLHPLPA